MSDSPKILIQRGAQRFGPFSKDEVLTHHAGQRFLPVDLAWSEGLPAWEPIGALMTRLGSPLPTVRGVDDTSKWLIPVGRSGWAIAAGYLALFSVLVVFAPLALFCGVMALRSLRKNPTLDGKGRAWFGIVMGGIFSAVLLFILISALLESS